MDKKQTRARSKIKLKSRSEGMTTETHDEAMRPIIGNEPSEKAPPTAEELELQIRFFDHVLYCATQRKARVEDLMQRRSANGWRNPRGRLSPGWSPAKKAVMVRRLMRAKEELDQAVGALGQLHQQLEQVKDVGPKPIGAVAKFVPPPATSV